MTVARVLSGVGPTWTVTSLRWLARVWGLGLLLLWGTFFVEHLEWFANPRELPPPWVFALVALHLTMLVALVLAWRFEAVGGALLVVSAVVFFAFANLRMFVPFVALTATPGLLWIACAWLDGTSRPGKNP